MKASDKIFYVHPSTTMARQCIMPYSVPALVKRLPYPVMGRFAAELTDDEIRSARVIFLDIHWYLSLYGAKQLVQRIKELSPETFVIAGGITASEYPGMIMDKFGVDFIIRGDGEKPFPMLVEAIMNGENDFSSIPNLWSREGLQNPRTYVLTAEDIEENDYLDIDFFPSFKKEVYKIHKRNVSPWSEVIHPYMMAFRGCPINCIGCAGGVLEQKKIFGRKPVIRSSERMKEDFIRCSENENIRFVSIYLDFITLLPPEYAMDVLDRQYDMSIRMEFNSKPSLDQAELVMNSFKGGVMNFCMDYMHLTSDKLIEPDHLIKLINLVKKRKEYFTVLSYNSIFARNNNEYKAALKYIKKETNCLISDESFYWTEHPIPDIDGFADEDMFEMHVELSKDKKFVKSVLTRSFEYMEPALPKSVALAIRLAQQRLAQNGPYAIKSLLGSV